MGPVGGLVGILLATVTLVSVVTNNAAAVLMFPIAISTAGQFRVSPRPFAIAVAIAASGSSLTPIAYQTNDGVRGGGDITSGDTRGWDCRWVALVVLASVVLIPAFWSF